jgi:hypothetical protein
MIPVKPPKVNKKIKPIAHIKGTLKFSCLPCKEIIHLNTLIPVGIAITIVAAVK